MIDRINNMKRLKSALARSPVVVLIGARGVGKTTMAKACAEAAKESAYYDLETDADQRSLQNPLMALGAARGLVVLDEIEEMPELLGVLRAIVDRPGVKAQFLATGRASPSLIGAASEALAGRIEFVHLAGFDLDEVGIDNWKQLWLRGGYPGSYLARTQEDSSARREEFIRTYLQRDLPQFGLKIPANVMRRFWTMLSHYHGHAWNATEIAVSMGLSDKTVRSYLDILTETQMARQLKAWHEDVSKRQVKAQKVYFRDSGILHHLLSIDNERALLGNPRVAASWEGFALEQVMLMGQLNEAYFWGTYARAEIDMFFMRGGKRYGIEFKYAETPDVNKSMRSAIETLKLDHMWVICPGEHRYELEKKITVTGLMPMMESSLAEVLRNC